MPDLPATAAMPRCPCSRRAVALRAERRRPRPAPRWGPRLPGSWPQWLRPKSRSGQGLLRPLLEAEARVIEVAGIPFALFGVNRVALLLAGKSGIADGRLQGERGDTHPEPAAV